MPRVNGLEVAREAKKRNPETPVILLTGWNMSRQAEAPGSEDVDRMIHKPVTLKALSHALAPAPR